MYLKRLLRSAPFALFHTFIFSAPGRNPHRNIARTFAACHIQFVHYYFTPSLYFSQSGLFACLA
jgi:hypothetical protein